jgi:hypothetical protein
MKLKRLIYFSLCLASGYGLMSCGSSEKKSDSDEFAASNDSLSENIKEVMYNIPSPSEIPFMLEATGAEFNESLLNSRAKVDQYASRHDKAALNLGVYAADIGYLTSYDKTQDAINYLTSCKSLADNLGVSGAFDAEILKKFESNISNKKSLAHLLDSIIKQTEIFLKDDKQSKLSALVITGSFIEGLYISTGVVNTYPKDILPADSRYQILTPLMRVILQQKKSVSELLKMLKAVDQTEPVVAIVADLTELEKVFTALDIEGRIASNRGDLVLTDKNLEEVTIIVGRLRAGITS